MLKPLQWLPMLQRHLDPKLLSYPPLRDSLTSAHAAFGDLPPPQAHRHFFFPIPWAFQGLSCLRALACAFLSAWRTLAFGTLYGCHLIISIPALLIQPLQREVFSDTQSLSLHTLLPCLYTSQHFILSGMNLIIYFCANYLLSSKHHTR